MSLQGTKDDKSAESTLLGEAETQKRNLADAYTLTSVDSSCKMIFKLVKCPYEPMITLCKTLQSVSNSAINAKLLQLILTSLKKEENIVEYSSRTVRLVWELEDAVHAVSMVEQKRALLCSFRNNYNATVETVISVDHNCNQAVLMLIVRETH